MSLKQQLRQFMSGTLAIALMSSSAVVLSVSEEKSERSSAKAQSIFADMENPELKRMASFRLDMTEFCAPITDQKRKHELYQELVKYHWDRKAMGCALQYGQELIEEDFWSYFLVEEKAELLAARAEYFSVLNKLYNAHYQGGELTDELVWRWQKNRREGMALSAELDAFSAWVNEVKLVQVAFSLASSQRETPTSEVVTISSAALVELNELVADDADLADGIAATLLAQMLISLPEFSGGDPLKAIDLLRESLSKSPNNLTAYRWLIEGFVLEREEDQAIEYLEKAAAVAVDQLPPQEYVDLAKELGGVAIRLGATDVANVFRHNRNQLLDTKPFLLERVERASVGHGGENPITGESQNQF